MTLVLAFRNLFRNFRRTIAILCTVALGAGALFCFQGFIQGVLIDYKQSTIHSYYGNGQIHTQGYRDTVYEDSWKHWIDNEYQVGDFLMQQEGVKYVFPRISLGGMLMHDNASIPAQGQGIWAEQEAKFFDKLNIDEGQMLESHKEGVMLGKGLAKALHANVGDKVTLYTKDLRGKIRKNKFQVVGIFHTGQASFDNRTFHIQLEDAQKLLRTNLVESIAIGLDDHQHWDNLAANIEKKFPKLEAASFAELNKIYYQHSVDWLKSQFAVVQVIILSIVLLGIFNTISASILERKQEIGNLRANGESALDVLKLVLCEGLLLGFIGTILGIAIAYAGAKGLLHKKVLIPPGPGFTSQSFLSFYFTGKMIITTFALNGISSIIASLLAGMKVVRMPIAKALRSH